MNETHALPAELTIYTVSEVWPLLQGWVRHDTAALDVHADTVSEIDAAGLQLLVALDKQLHAQDARLTLIAPSASLRSACEGLGVARLLGNDPTGEHHGR